MQLVSLLKNRFVWVFIGQILSHVYYVLSPVLSAGVRVNEVRAFLAHIELIV